MPTVITYDSTYSIWALKCGCIEADTIIKQPSSRRGYTHTTTGPNVAERIDDSEPIHAIIRLARQGAGCTATGMHGRRVTEIRRGTPSSPTLRDDLHLTPLQAAQRLHTSTTQIARWADKGYLTTRRTPGGHRRLSVSEVEEWAAADTALFQPPQRHDKQIDGQMAVEDL